MDVIKTTWIRKIVRKYIIVTLFEVIYRMWNNGSEVHYMHSLAHKINVCEVDAHGSLYNTKEKFILECK